ncbi:peroxiredoxin [Aureimonas sp. AU12]|uniref:peroxiredoxin n=1 Tax=Aureimonas sp. AU12 TaxID=1638161 RepID=UPI0007804DEA
MAQKPGGHAVTDLTILPEGLEAPFDDGAASHLLGRTLPRVALPATSGPPVDLGQLRGTVVLYAYPMTGRPGAPLPGGWNEIPGARGCTPQACGFRDQFAELKALGVAHVFGLSTQTTGYQREAAERLHLPFPLLSDAGLDVQDMLDLPTFEVDGDLLLKRLTMIVRDGEIVALFYPVFPPDRNAADVADWLRRHPEDGAAHH